VIWCFKCPRKKEVRFQKNPSCFSSWKELVMWVCKVLFIFFKSVFPLDVERPCTIGKLMLYIFSFIWKTLALTFAKRYHLIFQIHIHFYYLSVFCLLVCISLFATCLFLCVLIRFKLTVCRYVINNFSFCS